MRSITKLELALARLAEKEGPTNKPFAGVWLGPRVALATNRFVLAQVARDSEENSSDKTIFIPKNIAEKALKAVPRLGAWNRAAETVIGHCSVEGAQLKVEVGEVAFSRPVEEGLEPLPIKSAFQKVMGEDGKAQPVASITLSASALAALVDYLRVAFQRVKELSVTLHIFADAKAVYFQVHSLYECQRDLGAKLDGLIGLVPPREGLTYSPPAVFEQKEAGH